MNIVLGTFFDVTGVAVGAKFVSVLNREIETVIPIIGRYNRDTKRIDPPSVAGEFGDFSNVTEGEILKGLEPTGVTRVRILIDYADPEETFHTRLLHMETAAGHNLTWELYCDGLPN